MTARDAFRPNGQTTPSSGGRHDIVESEHTSFFWPEVDDLLTNEFSRDLMGRLHNELAPAPDGMAPGPAPAAPVRPSAAEAPAPVAEALVAEAPVAEAPAAEPPIAPVADASPAVRVRLSSEQGSLPGDPAAVPVRPDEADVATIRTSWPELGEVLAASATPPIDRVPGDEAPTELVSVVEPAAGAPVEPDPVVPADEPRIPGRHDAQRPADVWGDAGAAVDEVWPPAAGAAPAPADDIWSSLAPPTAADGSGTWPPAGHAPVPFPPAADRLSPPPNPFFSPTEVSAPPSADRARPGAGAGAGGPIGRAPSVFEWADAAEAAEAAEHEGPPPGAPWGAPDGDESADAVDGLRGSRLFGPRDEVPDRSSARRADRLWQTDPGAPGRAARAGDRSDPDTIAVASARLVSPFSNEGPSVRSLIGSPPTDDRLAAEVPHGFTGELKLSSPAGASGADDPGLWSGGTGLLEPPPPAGGAGLGPVPVVRFEPDDPERTAFAGRFPASGARPGPVGPSLYLDEEPSLGPSSGPHAVLRPMDSGPRPPAEPVGLTAGQRVALLAGALVLVAGLVAAGWFYLHRGGTSTTAGPSAGAGTATSTVASTTSSVAPAAPGVTLSTVNVATSLPAGSATTAAVSSTTGKATTTTRAGSSTTKASTTTASTGGSTSQSTTSTAQPTTTTTAQPTTTTTTQPTTTTSTTTPSSQSVSQGSGAGATSSESTTPKP